MFQLNLDTFQLSQDTLETLLVIWLIFILYLVDIYFISGLKLMDLFGCSMHRVCGAKFLYVLKNHLKYRKKLGQ